MLRLAALWAIVLAITTACGDRNLHVNVHWRDARGLAAGAPVVFNQRPVGTVEAIEADPAGGMRVRLALANKFAAAATTDSRFYIVDDAAASGKPRVEIEQDRPGGQGIAEGTTVEGSERLAGLIPFGEIFRQFGEGLKGLRDQVEQLQKELRTVPDSPEAKQLQQEWRRLTEELQKAQSQTEESVRKDLIPRLQQELDRLKEQFRRVEPPQKAAQPPRNL